MSYVAHTAITVIYIQIGVVHSNTFEGKFQPLQLIAVVNNLVLSAVAILSIQFLQMLGAAVFVQKLLLNSF